MKVLLDHNVPHGLRHDMPDDIDVQTASHLGWANYSDAELLEAAVQEGFAAVVTIDSNLRHQQHLPDWDIGEVTLNIHPESLKSIVSTCTQRFVHIGGVCPLKTRSSCLVSIITLTWLLSKI